MAVVDTQILEQEAPYSSIPGKLICGPQTQQLIDQGVLEEFPVHIVELLLEMPAYGLSFLEDFLTIAEVEPETNEKTPTRFAFCCVQNVRELAQMMGWGYDTAHKYVILFCALGLLQKYRYRHKVILQFPLRGYVFPDSLEELEKLIGKSRSRVQSLAARVKARCLELQMINQASVRPQLTESSTLVEEPVSSVWNSATNASPPLLQDYTNTHKYLTDEDKTKIRATTPRNNLNKDSEEPALFHGIHAYATECAKEQQQATFVNRSDLFTTLVTQLLLNDKYCYEKYVPQLCAGEILHISIIKNKKDGEKSAEDEILASGDIYPQHVKPGFPINRYAGEYLGYDQSENSTYRDNRRKDPLDSLERNGHYSPVESQTYLERDSTSIPPQESSPVSPMQESGPCATLVQTAKIPSPTPSNTNVLYEEIVVPAGMPKLRERWLAEGRIVERLDDNGRLKTYKVCKEQTEQAQYDQTQVLSPQQTYSQADEQTTTPWRPKRRKRPIYNEQDYFQTSENEQAPQIVPPSLGEITRQVPPTEQTVATRVFSQPATLTPIANHISTVTQTIQNRREAKRTEQESNAPDKQSFVSRQKKSSVPHSLSSPAKSALPSPTIQPAAQVSLVKTEKAPGSRSSLPEHLIPLECWDKEAIAECERTYQPVPGDKLDFSYDDLHYYQTVYEKFPSAETFLEIDAYRDWYSADFDEDFLRAYDTFNVITFFKYIINNKNNIQKRNTFITFLVSIFDKKSVQKEKSATYYYQLFKNDYHPDVISCAFLSTMLAMYSKGRETIEKPGAIFIKSCQTLQKTVNEEGHIPYSDLKAARKFGNFTFADLAVALHDNLVSDGATESLSVYLAATFAINSCYRSQSSVEVPISPEQDEQNDYYVASAIHEQEELASPERKVS